MRGSRPKPVKVEESSGALLGRRLDLGREGTLSNSTLGLDVKRDEMTWVGIRGAEEVAL